jgi:hypothetical protein
MQVEETNFGTSVMALWEVEHNTDGIISLAWQLLGLVGQVGIIS